MIFAIYKGLPDDRGEGKFTKGRLYLADPEVDDTTVVDINRLEVTDDTGERIWIEPNNGRFEYPEEIYGVVVKELGPKHPGEVVVITEADDGFFEIKGAGYIREAYIQLLDSTIVRPGMMVYDRSRTRWDRIRRVDECMRLRLEDSDDMRDCTDFVFAVSDGDISTVPLLRCLDDTGRTDIRKGSIYRVAGLDKDGLLLVEDDQGREMSFEPERFEFV